MENEATFRERVAFLFNPERGRKLYEERMQKEMPKKENRKHGNMSMASGYANHGASTTQNSMVGWIVGGGDAEEDLDSNASTLRKRARDLYAGGGLARSGPATLTTNVVGWGIQPKPKIDSDVLGMSEDAASEWENNALREFKLWANTPMCDAERSKNFWTIQQLAFRNELMSGDCFILFGMKDNVRTPYKLTIRLLEADRVCTPDSGGDSRSEETDSGGRIVDGVEIDKEGMVIRYHIANKHPLGASGGDIDYVTVDAIGKNTGMPNILHITTYERPEQRRGMPFVSSQIEQIKQLDRYINSELAANVVSSMLTAFITTDTDDGRNGLEDAINEDEKVSNDDYQIELAPGAIYDLPAGRKVTSINPIRNNATFKDFVGALTTLIGASVGIPEEVLTKKYEHNYTAARGALLDFWKEVKVHRTMFINSFCVPIWEAWLTEAVASGRIEAPGFFEDPIIRQAWCGCMWMGASMGHIDPLKEANAAEKRIALHMTTEEQEASEYNGNDWNANVLQRKKELAAFPNGEKAAGTYTEEDTDDGEE